VTADFRLGPRNMTSIFSDFGSVFRVCRISSDFSSFGKNIWSRILSKISGHPILSTALNLVHRHLFPKLANFPLYFTQLCNFPGGGHFRKACRSRKIESKQSEITCKQSKPARTISKIQKRREFGWALCYEQCPKNSFKRFYIVKGLLVLVEKASFSKEFRWEFQCGGEGNIIQHSLAGIVSDMEFKVPGSRLTARTWQFICIYKNIFKILNFFRRRVSNYLIK